MPRNSLTSAGHALAGSLDVKIAWTKVQYLGIASVPPLWFLFTAEYAGARWSGRGDQRMAPGCGDARGVCVSGGA